MNFSATKSYGKMVSEVAGVVDAADNIYEAAEALQYDNMEHYLKARLAFTEVMAFYSHEKELVSFVIDEYVTTNEVMEVFFTKVERSSEAKIEFVRRDLGNQHLLLCHIQLFLHTLRVLSHPDRFEDGQLKIAIENVVKPILENSEVNNAVFVYCFQHEYLKRVESHKERIDKRKYVIGNERLLLKIYDYLKSTEVIDDTLTLQIFIGAIENANVSRIRPKLKDNFKCSLTHIKECIRNNKKQWLRDVCNSINILPKDASKNGTNLGEWYEKLCDLVAITLKK